MEPRKGALGLIAPRAKAASARAILALAVAAALVASGCGGDSDPETASSPSAPATAEGAVDPAAAAAPRAARPKGASSAPGNKSPAGAATPTPGQGTGQGASVPLPTKGRERSATPEEEAEATIADMTLASPALSGPEPSLPSQYTCDGKDSWPPLRWAGTPPGTEELVLFAMGSQPVEGKLFFAWALAGIDPALTEIEAGKLPRGAIAGRNGFGQAGYSICPALGEAETYVFALFALPEALSPARGFDPREVRREVLEVSGNVGLMAASYSR